MCNTILYIHGQGGNAAEAEHYKSLFPNHKVIGLDYAAQTPWEAKKEFPQLLQALGIRDKFILIANSIGAYFAMHALPQERIEKAFFISPIVDMEKLIADMMRWANVTEKDLQEKGRIETDFGQTLSWDYLVYVRNHPLCWRVPTHILYGDRDNLTAPETVVRFAKEKNATLSVLEGGEHWFHTAEQMTFLDNQIHCFLER